MHHANIAARPNQRGPRKKRFLQSHRSADLVAGFMARRHFISGKRAAMPPRPTGFTGSPSSQILTCSGGTNARFASGGNNTAKSAPLIKLAFCIPERCADGAAWAREWRAALEYCSGRRELNPHHITAISMRAAFKG
ncbi:hypothetical protein SKAU_G00314640 [Synaphobranchus kaupii]|uniref:Uncharacterized protein n=1 Tax=Synaphobranchus kaupii TaxID=118154 RepID=A0A9Q1ESC2_SYNKA|nr:hypothetical protein SKAU_G00314640 [Synaphobranchus kaupii]